jgi:hypothetical protein
MKINAPSFIYNILHGTNKHISGHSANHDTIDINGIMIDKNIPKEAILKLNQISEIEPRSSCEGTDADRPTFFIFRLKIRTNPKIIVDKLNKYPNITAGWDIGNGGKARIGVTTNLWYDKDPEKFKKWWLKLPNIIQKSVS